MTRPLLATSMAALACASVMLAQAEAADVTAPSRVDAVIVYPSGAEIARTLKVKVEPGEHAVVINDLPAGALPQCRRQIDRWSIADRLGRQPPAFCAAGR
jgi:hypothetical protein